MKLSSTQSYVLSCWRKAQKSCGKLPARQDLTLRDLGKHASEIAVIAVRSNPDDFEYCLIGTTLEAYFRKDYTGKRLSEIDHEGADHTLWQSLKATVRAGKPKVFNIPYSNSANRKEVRTLSLPLAQDRETPDKVILVPDLGPAQVGSLHVTNSSLLGTSRKSQRPS